MISFFKDKTVTLMGLGLLGRGVGDAAFLAQQCKKVFVTDTKNAHELRVSVDALKDYTNIEFFLGGHNAKLFTDVDFVIKGAGVRLDNPYIEQAHKHHVPVYMSTALFAHLTSIQTIGITGTRGKTTTTCMIADILKHAGKKVLLGGNIRGVSTLALLPEADQFDIAVLELDSWQMQGFDSLKISPHISVFTTFTADHMNYYDGDMDRYFEDKSAIFRYQKKDDIFITTDAITDLAKKKGYDKNHLSEWIRAEPLPSDFQMKVPGIHNLMNASLAKAVGQVCFIDEKIIDDSLHMFSAVEGRLQWVGRWNERDFYNDSNATTQEATLAALTAFPSASIVLIFGGADKGLPIDRMLSMIADENIRCVLLKGTGSDRVLETLPHLTLASTMGEALDRAKEMSQTGDRIILSPAFASFGMFKNEYDRSDQFMGEVKKLIAEESPCPR